MLHRPDSDLFEDRSPGGVFDDLEFKPVGPDVGIPTPTPAISKRAGDGEKKRCCPDIDLTVSSATAGPVEVQVIHCAECEDVRETVVIEP